MEDYIDVDAMYEERTHLADEAEVGWEEYTNYDEDLAWEDEDADNIVFWVRETAQTYRVV